MVGAYDFARCTIRIAGNTWNPALLVLREKGYNLQVDYDEMSDGNFQSDYQAEKDGKVFSATCPVALLGLVSIYEARGDDWQTQKGEPDIYDELGENEEKRSANDT